MGCQPERWHIACDGGLKDGDLKRLKLCVMAGSLHSDFEIQDEEEAHLANLVKDLDAINVKVFGFGGGARVLAKSLGHDIVSDTRKSDSKL